MTYQTKYKTNPPNTEKYWIYFEVYHNFFESMGIFRTYSYGSLIHMRASSTNESFHLSYFLEKIVRSTWRTRISIVFNRNKIWICLWDHWRKRRTTEAHQSQWGKRDKYVREYPESRRRFKAVKFGLISKRFELCVCSATTRRSVISVNNPGTECSNKEMGDFQVSPFSSGIMCPIRRWRNVPRAPPCGRWLWRWR